jgi:asparagine synthase (glutamine-hydrolysing)
MCGIAGAIHWQENQETKRDIFIKMQETLRRRGPDQNGLYISPEAALIHARLSVVDLTNGIQPMHLAKGDGELVLVYNGELYNTEELRAELAAKGHRFEGHSDTEVLLHAYAQWGYACVDRFNGIFAFAVWETATQSLFLARDRMGVKPLFYCAQKNSLLFASEIKALLAHPGVEPVVTLDSIAEIMLIGPGRTPGYGVFSGIEELKPGCCATYTRYGFRAWQYWKLTDHPHEDSFEQTVEKTRALVSDAIERQLVSDVPLGTFLSGGLDSSIISSVANRHFRQRGQRLNTFSVEYRDNAKYFKTSKFQPNSDESYIERMCAYLGSEHHRIVLDTDELTQALFEAVKARDLPGMADVDASLLLFCREIKKHVTVALSGECADEIFGGYPWYRDKEIRERYGFPWAQSTAYRASFLTPELAEQIDGPAYVDRRYADTLAACSILPGTSPDERRMKEMVNLNFNWFMQTLLDRKDRMSMYSGLEVRVPFCDVRIAEYLYGVPWEYKDYNGTEKGLLRMAMQDILPEEVLWRKKSPYPKTHNPAYLAQVSRLLREVIEDASSPLLHLVKKDAVDALLLANNPTPWYGQLMTTPQTIAYLLQVNYWLDQYNIRIA